MRYLKDEIDDVDYIIDNYKYKSLEDYIEANKEDLKNHIIKNEDLYELSHLLLYKHIDDAEDYIKEKVKKLYNDIFRYTYRPSVQHYEDIDEIKLDISYIKDIADDSDKEQFEFIVTVSIEEIELLQKIYNLWKYENIIVEDSVFEYLDIRRILNEDIEDYIIKKYAKDISIREEYCSDQEELYDYLKANAFSHESESANDLIENCITVDTVFDILKLDENKKEE